MGQGDVGSCCAKYLLCMFNFIFFVSSHVLIQLSYSINDTINFFFTQILGSLVLGIGLWLLCDKDSILALMKNVNSEHIDVSINLDSFGTPTIISIFFGKHHEMFGVEE